MVLAKDTMFRYELPANLPVGRQGRKGYKDIFCHGLDGLAQIISASQKWCLATNDTDYTKRKLRENGFAEGESIRVIRG